MAEDFSAKTESPTPAKRERARKEGRLAVSPELLGAAGLLTATLFLRSTISTWRSIWTNFFQISVESIASVSVTENTALRHSQRTIYEYFQAVSPLLLLLIFVIGVLGLVKTRWNFTLQPLAIDWSHLLRGMQNWNFAEKARAFGMTLGRLFLVGAILLVYSLKRADLWTPASTFDFSVQMYRLESHWIAIFSLFSGLMFIIGAADYGIRYWKLERSLRMTKQELRDELKREEGDPAIKGKVRQIQREMAKNRMMSQVKMAKVIITNPTHLAVALAYDAGRDRAPRLVAKGAGSVAKAIVDLAKKENIPVIQRREIARAIFANVKLNAEVPVTLYRVLAEIFAYVHRIRPTAGAN